MAIAHVIFTHMITLITLITLQQGPPVEYRVKDVSNFWKHNILSPYSNGVFGEGGAGSPNNPNNPSSPNCPCSPDNPP